MYASQTSGAMRHGHGRGSGNSSGSGSGSAAPGPGTSAVATGSTTGAAKHFGETLDRVKNEFETTLQQLHAITVENNAMQRKFHTQATELDQIQQVLRVLETNHQRIRQQYEDDLARLRLQLKQSQSGGGGNGDLHGNVAMPPPATVARAMRNVTTSSMAAPHATETPSVPSLPMPPLRPPTDQHSTLPTVPSQLPSLGHQREQPGSGTSDNNKANGSNGSPPALKKLRASAHTSAATASEQSAASHSDSRHKTSSSSRGPSSSSSSSKSQRSPGHHDRATSNPSPSSTISDKSPKKISPKAQSSSAQKTSPSTTSSNSVANQHKWKFSYNSGATSFGDSERPGAEMAYAVDHQSVVCCVRFSPDGAMMASGCRKAAQVIDIQTGERKMQASRVPEKSRERGGSASDPDEGHVRAVCFSHDNTKLFAGMLQNTISVWDIASNEEERSLSGHESEIYSLDCVRDLIASGSGDRTVRLWDVRNGQCRHVLGGGGGSKRDDPSDGITSVALSRDGQYLAASSLDKVVRVWDTETAQLLDRFEGHNDAVYSIAFSPDDKSIVSGSFDGSIMMWGVGSTGRSSSSSSSSTTRPRMVFQGHKDFVLSVVYSPDGRWLMSGSKDRSVVFWDPRTTRSVLTVSGFRNSIISVASSPASPYFATGSGDCNAVVWKYQSQSM